MCAELVAVHHGAPEGCYRSGSTLSRGIISLGLYSQLHSLGRRSPPEKQAHCSVRLARQRWNLPCAIRTGSPCHCRLCSSTAVSTLRCIVTVCYHDDSGFVVWGRVVCFRLSSLLYLSCYWWTTQLIYPRQLQGSRLGWGWWSVLLHPTQLVLPFVLAQAVVEKKKGKRKYI